MEATPYDSHFDDLNRVAIHKAEVRIRAQDDLPRNLLYEGFAYALRARLDGLHDRETSPDGSLCRKNAGIFYFKLPSSTPR